MVPKISANFDNFRFPKQKIDLNIFFANLKKIIISRSSCSTRRRSSPPRQSRRESRDGRRRASTCCLCGSEGSWTSCAGPSSSTCRRWP